MLQTVSRDKLRIAISDARFRQKLDQLIHEKRRREQIRPVSQANGEWLLISLELPGFKLWIRTWEVQVGRTKLYLLDTNDPANLPDYRGITSELYGGGPEVRIGQEQVLGIGGWRLLRAVGMSPEVCHLNEGHAAFAVLERARSYMAETQQPFDVALTIARAGNLFTTHTPVEAGFDRFAPELIEKYFRYYSQNELGISIRELLAFGRQNPKRCVRAIQHGVSCDARQRGGERSQPSARRSKSTHFSGLVPTLADG